MTIDHARTGHMSAPPPDGEPRTSSVGRVRALAQQMQDRCLRLDELSNAIRDRIDSDSTDEVVDLLARREPLVVDLARFGGELAAILDDPDAARSLGDDEHKQICGRLADLEQVMGRIRERDRAARLDLQRRRDGLSDRLNTMEAGRGAVRAYGNAGQHTNPTVQDTQG